MPASRGLLLLNRRSGALPDAEKEQLRGSAIEAGLDAVDVGPELDVNALVESRRATGTRLFVTAGGDGSIHSVAQSLVGTDAVLAVVPTGSLNHFARDLGLPLSWREALEVALSGGTRSIDVGKINERYFLNNVLLGIYPKISEYRERYRSLGKWRAYARSVRLALRRFPDVAIELETAEGLERVRTQMFTVSVGTDDLSRLGFLAPRVALKEGSLHVYWLPFLSRRAFALAAARYFLGVSENFGDFRSLDTVRLTISSRRKRIQVATDGELSQMRSPIEISVVPSALRVRVVQ